LLVTREALAHRHLEHSPAAAREEQPEDLQQPAMRAAGLPV
jgi:hypothetical protein